MLQVREQDTSLLVELGLTASEAKAYLSLILIGKTPIQPLSKLTGIPREYLYQIVHSLEKKGLVQKELGPTSEFKAVPLERTLSSLINDKKTQISKLQEESQKLIVQMKNRKIQTNLLKNSLQEGPPQFVIVPGGDVIVGKIKLAIQTAQNSIDIVTTQRRFLPAIFELDQEFEKSLQNGVKIRVLTESKEVAEQSSPKMVRALTKNKNFEVRYFNSSPEAIVAIFDRKYVFVTISIASKFSESPRLWSNSESILALAQGFFEAKWIISEKEKVC